MHVSRFGSKFPDMGSSKIVVQMFYVYYKEKEKRVACGSSFKQPLSLKGFIRGLQGSPLTIFR